MFWNISSFQEKIKQTKKSSQQNIIFSRKYLFYLVLHMKNKSQAPKESLEMFLFCFPRENRI